MPAADMPECRNGILQSTLSFRKRFSSANSDSPSSKNPRSQRTFKGSWITHWQMSAGEAPGSLEWSVERRGRKLDADSTWERSPTEAMELWAARRAPSRPPSRSAPTRSTSFSGITRKLDNRAHPAERGSKQRTSDFKNPKFRCSVGLASRFVEVHAHQGSLAQTPIVTATYHLPPILMCTTVLSINTPTRLRAGRHIDVAVAAMLSLHPLHSSAIVRMNFHPHFRAHQKRSSGTVEYRGSSKAGATASTGLGPDPSTATVASSMRGRTCRSASSAVFLLL